MDQKVTTLTKLLKLSPIVKNGHALVIGGGISGLTFGYFLGYLRPDLRITILEKEDRLGGYIRSQPTHVKGKPKTILEKGPRTLRGVSTGTLLIADILHRTGNIGVINGVHMSSNGNKKYIMAKTNGSDLQLLKVPGPGESFGTLMSFLGSSPGWQMIKGMFKDLFNRNKPDVYNPRKDLSVEEFFTRHFGKGLINEVGSALMYGIYACDVKNLSVRCVMPAMAEIGEKSPSLIRHAIRSAYENKQKKDKSTMEVLEREIEKKDDALAIIPLDEEVKEYIKEFSSGLNMVKLKGFLKEFPMLALTGGLETLVTVLKDNLPNNVEVILKDGVKNIENRGDKVFVQTTNGKDIQCDHLRSTVNAYQLERAFKSEEISQTLSQFQYTSVTVANVYIKRNVKSLTGFGFLVPKALFNRDKRLMGVIFDSDIESSAKGIFNLENITAVESDKEQDLKKLAMSVHKSTEDSHPDFTKVTFMFNIDGEVSSGSKLRGIVSEIFDTQFGADLQDEDWFLEYTHYHRAIPMYDVEYLWRKREIVGQLTQEFDAKISLGGMAFARGVGVPDCVLTSFQSALELAK